MDERYLALFPAGTIVVDSHHPKSPTGHEWELNLRRIQILLNEAVHLQYVLQVLSTCD